MTIRHRFKRKFQTLLRKRSLCILESLPTPNGKFRRKSLLGANAVYTTLLSYTTLVSWMALKSNRLFQNVILLLFDWIPCAIILLFITWEPKTSLCQTIQQQPVILRCLYEKKPLGLKEVLFDFKSYVMSLLSICYSWVFRSIYISHICSHKIWKRKSSQ